MTAVWERFPASGSELLAMLALADWCDDNGGSLFPSISAVARKIRLSAKQARRILHAFEGQGFLAVVGNEAGGAPGTTRQYRLNVAKIMALPVIEENDHGRVGTPPAEGSPPDGSHGGEGSHGCPETAPMGGSQTTIEPLQKEKKGAAPKIGFDFDAARFVNLPDDQITIWAECYPAIDVVAELRKAAAWQQANPKNRKSDYKRFLNGWLSRAQDRAPRAGAAPAPRFAQPRPMHRTSFEDIDYSKGVRPDGSF